MNVKPSEMRAFFAFVYTFSMKIATKQLITAIVGKLQTNIQRAESLKNLPLETLNHKEHINSWSALECIEHLNLYGDFYLPAIKTAIEHSKTKPDTFFKGGFIGNYFVKAMLPKEKLNKMKTAEDKNPAGSDIDINVIDRFIQQQRAFLKLIEKSKNINLTKTKTAISISKLIKLRLGDTFRFIVAHNERHLIQAERAIEAKAHSGS